MKNFQPYENEKDSIGIGELTIENRLDRIEIYGSLQVTKDKAGLKLAQQLKVLVDLTVAALEAENLPDQVAVAKTDSVDNPFK